MAQSPIAAALNEAVEAVDRLPSCALGWRWGGRRQGRRGLGDRQEQRGRRPVKAPA